MKRYIHPVFPCDPGLTCTYPNCNCKVKLAYSTDDYKSVPRVTFKFWIGLMSAGIIIIGIFLLSYFYDSIMMLINGIVEILLTDKPIGLTFALVLVSVVVVFVVKPR